MNLMKSQPKLEVLSFSLCEDADAMIVSARNLSTKLSTTKQQSREHWSKKLKR